MYSINVRMLWMMFTHDRQPQSAVSPEFITDYPVLAPSSIWQISHVVNLNILSRQIMDPSAEFDADHAQNVLSFANARPSGVRFPH